MAKIAQRSGRYSFRVDGELDRGVRKYAKENGLTMSQAARELLRQAIGQPPIAIDRGWKEGFARGMAEVKRRFAEATTADE